MIFRLTSELNISKKVETTEIGMERLMIAVLRGLPRNRYNTTTARMPPIIAVLSTSATDALINVAWLKTTSIRAPEGNAPVSFRKRSNASVTRPATVTVLASPSL